ncbi:MAG TPA: metallophosphoesterase, partial [Acidimicrobiia bacterium]
MVAALLGTSLTLRPTLAVSPPAPTSFTFGSAGDFTANADAAATLTTLAGSGTDVFVATGDLSYNTAPESAWCDFVKSKVGSTYPFEIVSGNHEDNGPNGTVGNFTACLPDRIGNVSGTYGREYFFDYPPAAPLARFIMISPDLTFADGTVEYTNGGVHTAWLANAIDDARAQGVRWVIVGMHKPCLSAGSKACTIGTDLQNLLVAKK